MASAVKTARESTDLNMEFRSFYNGLKKQHGGMQNGDEASPSIISAGRGILRKILLTLEQHGLFCILKIHFNIVYYQRRSFKCQPTYSNKSLSPLFYYHSCMFVVFLLYEFLFVCLVVCLFGLILYVPVFLC